MPNKNIKQEDRDDIMAAALATVLKDCDDVSRHISVIVLNTLRALDIVGKENRELTMAILPTDMDKGYDSTTKNSGMVATAQPNSQVHQFATMILAYCLKNGIDIEPFANDVFGTVMTAKVGVRTKED